jgi:hypothetical protein
VPQGEGLAGLASKPRARRGWKERKHVQGGLAVGSTLTRKKQSFGREQSVAQPWAADLCGFCCWYLPAN